MRNVMQLKGNKLAAVFRHSWILSTFFIYKLKITQSIAFNLVFNEDSKMGSAMFVPFVSLKLLWKKTEKYNYASICLPLAYPSDI